LDGAIFGKAYRYGTWFDTKKKGRSVAKMKGE